MTMNWNVMSVFQPFSVPTFKFMVVLNVCKKSQSHTEFMLILLLVIISISNITYHNKLRVGYINNI